MFHFSPPPTPLYYRTPILTHHYTTGVLVLSHHCITGVPVLVHHCTTGIPVLVRHCTTRSLSWHTTVSPGSLSWHTTVLPGPCPDTPPCHWDSWTGVPLCHRVPVLSPLYHRVPFPSTPLYQWGFLYWCPTVLPDPCPGVLLYHRDSYPGVPVYYRTPVLVYHCTTGSLF